jgi:IS30 family transposase
LSDDEREQIGLAKALGHSIGAIAKAIGRPKSTVSRELSRNKLPSGRYSLLHAAFKSVPSKIPPSPSTPCCTHRSLLRQAVVVSKRNFGWFDIESAFSSFAQKK